MSKFNLFPSPSSPVSWNLRTLRPATVIGRTPSSTAALKKILQENNEKWHIFFNDGGFHNHTAHTAIALWALGGNERILNASYKLTEVYQRALYDSPNEITQENWKDFLGDPRYYKAYLKFFENELFQKGLAHLLNAYVFSPEANFNTTTTDAEDATKSKHPEMLNRIMEGLIHPFIHLGYGLEFNLPVMVVEGIAQAAIHPASSSLLIPPRLFAKTGTEEATTTKPKGIDALSVLSRIQNDPELNSFKPTSLDIDYAALAAVYAENILGHVDQWDLDDANLEKNIEELIWVVTLLYGVCGSQKYYQESPKERSKGKTSFNADFFIAHCVTSAHFLPSWVAHIPASSAKLLLRSYFSVILTWYILRGTPKITVETLTSFFSDPTTLNPKVPGPQPAPSHGALGVSPNDTSNLDQIVNPNAWHAVLQTTLFHPDEHVPKLLRSLKYFAELFEHTENLKDRFKDTELEGVELVDGTLFLRAAVLSTNRTGWPREGTSLAEHAEANITALFVWDREGFFP